MGLAGKPSDEEHPYGHRQLESIAAMVVGAFVLTTAVAIFWDSINKVFDLWTGSSSYGGASLFALMVALATIVVKIFLTLFTQRIGRETENPALSALAYDHRNDIFAASAASIGIFLGRMGYSWVDPLAGALVAVVILRTGIEIMRESSTDLMDTVPGNALNEKVRQIVMNTAEVHQVEEVLAHRFGPYLVLNVTICIDGALSVAEGDRIATEVEQALSHGIDMVQRVHVHYHPVSDECPRD
jgi:cation diffusion facilitator family transporter